MGMGQVTLEKNTPTLAREGHDAVIRRMGDLIEDLIREGGKTKANFKGIGIGVPGKLDIERGVVLFLPNLHGTWPNVLLEPIRRTVRERNFVSAMDNLEIVPAALADTAGMIGAALWAKNTFEVN